MRVAGVDGCRRGWVVADDDAVSVVASFAEVLARGYDMVGVDIPIGLVDSGTRRCDAEARKLLGRPRAASVFTAPMRCGLHAATWLDAAECYKAATGKSLPQQAFGLFSKVREVDALMTPALQERVVEVHPEVSFAALNNGVAMTHPKRTAAGRAERLAVLPAGSDLPKVKGAAPDDVFDALAVLWSARGAAEGRAHRLGGGELDPRGLRMEIAY